MRSFSGRGQVSPHEEESHVSVHISIVQTMMSVFGRVVLRYTRTDYDSLVLIEAERLGATRTVAHTPVRWRSPVSGTSFTRPMDPPFVAPYRVGEPGGIEYPDCARIISAFYVACFRCSHHNLTRIAPRRDTISPRRRRSDGAASSHDVCPGPLRIKREHCQLLLSRDREGSELGAPDASSDGSPAYRP